MKRRFTDAQMIGIVKEHEAGIPARELCRKYGMPHSISGRRGSQAWRSMRFAASGTWKRRTGA